MKKKVILAIIFLVAALMVGLSFVQQNNEKQGQVCFQDYCFNVELAITANEKGRGLMFREFLDLSEGMLFIYEEEGNYSFWMKNTLISLDIIWINKNQEVVFMNENSLPCEEDFCPIIIPAKRAKYVLEINGGLSQEIGLTLGDRLEFAILADN